MGMEDINIPQYNGSESANEDIVYSYFRFMMNSRGYSFRVKRTGYSEIDGIIPSSQSGILGKGSCDAYFFSGDKAEDFYGLLELETTGKLELGVAQIRKYASGFNSHTLDNSQKHFINKLKHKQIILVVYDGQQVYLSLYNIQNNEEHILICNEPIDDADHNNSQIILSCFPDKSIISREQDEKELISDIARIIRGNEKIQKNKAFIMTVLSSVYGQTKDVDLGDAVKRLKDSQVSYDQILYGMWEELKKIIDDNDKINKLYIECASKLYELSQERGMDLYGFIYEELATKDAKKEQGEYYTPRHTIRPLISAVYNNYLKWNVDELPNKNVVDIFCGSGGFLYEYIHFIRKKYDLSPSDINKITEKSIYGFDKNGVLSAQLNMYLVGDGKTNLSPVNTSINWRKHFLYRQKTNSKYDLSPLDKKKEIKDALSKNIQDINNFLKIYVDRDFSLELDDILKHYKTLDDIINTAIIDKLSSSITQSSELGNVDLLVTNVPYGKVTDATHQITVGGKKLYGNSLEANALHECIDLLRPAKLKGIQRVENGGIGIIIVPDSILENPTNKPIRDYLIARCNILAIVSLPEYTFSPYAMEKTYAIIIQKIAPEEFDYNRQIDCKTFMYYASCDGRANSKNRYKTNRVAMSTIKTRDGIKKVHEFIHNDFEPFFEPYENGLEYYSKIERAWNPSTFFIDPEWDQIRILETWNGQSWNVKKGRKWGYFEIERVKRINKVEVSCKSLKEKIEEYLYTMNREEQECIICNINILKTNIINEYALSSKENKKLNEIDAIEQTDREIKLLKFEHIQDVNLNIDSEKYLGETKHPHIIENMVMELREENFSQQELIDYFTNDVTSIKYTPVRLMDVFNVIQGVQFSKEDAYHYPGNVPVFTAATDGPAYFVKENINGKTMLQGRTLIWSRKGAKAGTIQIYNKNDKFYISDVSGTIMPKNPNIKYDFTFLKYYIEGQLKKERQSISNNAQVNKSKVENLQIFIPDEQFEIGDVIRKMLKVEK